MSVKEQEKSKGRLIIFLFLAFIAFNIIVFNLYPLYDDWGYSTAPIKHFSADMLRPGAAFWRPIDVLFGVFMGLVPWAFPWLNRAVVILSHIISAYFLNEIAVILDYKKSARIFSLCFFCFSPGVWSVVVSPDALNQSFALMFGALSIYAFLKQKNILYIVFCILAVFSKESGIIWFFAAPLISVIAEKKTFRSFFKEKKLLKHIIIYYMISLVLVAGYFGLRFALKGEAVLSDASLTGEGERYIISLSPLRIIKNLAILTGGSLGGVDSVSIIFGDSYIPGIVTCVISAAFFIYSLYLAFLNRKKKGTVFSLLILAAVIAATALPHTVMSQPSEMNGYPTVFAFALFYGYIFNFSDIPKKAVIAGVVCLSVCFLTAGVHKLICIYDYSGRTRILANKMIQNYDDLNESLLIAAMDKSTPGYSCFTHSAAFGTKYGLSMREYFGWEEINADFERFDDRAEAAAFVSERTEIYDNVWIVEENDDLTVIK